MPPGKRLLTQASVGTPSALAWLGTALALFAGPGCSAPDYPPLLGDTIPDTGGAAYPTLPAESPQPNAPTCNLGPGGGVCACVDQPLVGDPPNLYFVLDRSGSMSVNRKWSTIVGVLGELVAALGPRIKIGAAAFPDPRVGADQCGPGQEVFPLTQGDSPAGWLGPVGFALLRRLNQLTPSGGTPTAATLGQLAPKLGALGGKTYVVLATDGGPNCNSSARCTAATCEYNIDGVCFPATDNCCAVPGYNTGCLDSVPTTKAVSAMSALGIPVYIVGVPGSAPYANLLDALAIAGGTARTVEPRYYDVRTADESALRSALFQIAARVAGSCTLQLNALPPSPSLVNVFLDETPLPKGMDCGDPSEASTVDGATGSQSDTTDGSSEEGPLDVASEGASAEGATGDFPADGLPESEAQIGSYPAGPDGSTSAYSTGRDSSTSPTGTPGPACNWTVEGETVTILGAACNRIMSGDVLDVRVVAGCPTLIR